MAGLVSPEASLFGKQLPSCHVFNVAFPLCDTSSVFLFEDINLLKYPQYLTILLELIFLTLYNSLPLRSHGLYSSPVRQCCYFQNMKIDAQLLRDLLKITQLAKQTLQFKPNFNDSIDSTSFTPSLYHL